MTLLLTILLVITTPVVTITSLVNNQRLHSGTVNFAASVTYTGTINKMVFLKNGVVIGTDYTVPYVIPVTLQPGTYSLGARAYYNSNASYRTSTITVTVEPDYEVRIAALEKRVTELEKPDTVIFDPAKFSVIPETPTRTRIKMK